MKKVVASALLATVVSAAALPSTFAATSSVSFVDIDSSYAKAAIQELLDKGIVTGMDTQGHFSPKGTLTRAQFAKILVLELGLKADATTSTFTDVTGWAVPYIEAASQAGLVNGVGGNKFEPDAPVTREMAATMLVRSLQTEGKLEETDATVTFKDASSIAGWAQSSIALAQKYSLVQGNPDGTFDPKTSTNREMAAQMGVNLLRAVDVVVEANTAPVISGVSLVSSNEDPTKAVIGDKVTLSFITNQQVTKLTSFKINGSNPDTFASEEQADHTWKNVATYVIQDSDPTGVMNFQINVKNNAGLYSITTEATTDNSSVTIAAPAATDPTTTDPTTTEPTTTEPAASEQGTTEVVL